MTEPLRTKITEATKKGVSAIGYEGVGNMEFLVDKYQNFYFMEMNTRIQVEYLLTEAVTGFDLLRTQIEMAAGKPLDIPNLYPKGHAEANEKERLPRCFTRIFFYRPRESRDARMHQ